MNLAVYRLTANFKMKKKVINGNVIPTIKSVVDELKYLKNEFSDLRNVAIEIANDGEVYGGIKPSLANTCCPRSLAVGNHNGRVYENFYGLSLAESDYRLRKIAKDIIEEHIWCVGNGF